MINTILIIVGNLLLTGLVIYDFIKIDRKIEEVIATPV